MSADWTQQGWRPAPKTGLPTAAIVLMAVACLLLIGGVAMGLSNIQERSSYRDRVEQEGRQYVTQLCTASRNC